MIFFICLLFLQIFLFAGDQQTEADIALRRSVQHSYIICQHNADDAQKRKSKQSIYKLFLGFVYVVSGNVCRSTGLSILLPMKSRAPVALTGGLLFLGGVFYGVGMIAGSKLQKEYETRL